MVNHSILYLDLVWSDKSFSLGQEHLSDFIINQRLEESTAGWVFIHNMKNNFQIQYSHLPGTVFSLCFVQGTVIILISSLWNYKFKNDFFWLTILHKSPTNYSSPLISRLELDPSLLSGVKSRKMKFHSSAIGRLFVILSVGVWFQIGC